MVAVMLMLLVLTGVNMALPAFIKLLIDDVFPEHNWTLLWVLLVAIVGVYLARNTLYFFSKYHAVAIGEQVCFSLRKRLFEHLQRMNLQYYRQNPAGKMSSRVMNDSMVIQQFIQDQLPKLLQSLLLFVALLAVLYAVNWSLAIACTIVLPMHLVVFWYFKRPIKASSRVAQDQLDVVQGNMIEKFLGAEVVKGFTAESRENTAFTEAIELSRDKQIKGKTFHVAHKVAADLLVGVGTVALLGYGAYQVMGPRGMAVGEFVMFFGYVGMLYPNLLELISGFSKFSRTTACVDRAFEVLHSGPIEVSGSRRLPHPVKGTIQFDHVGVRYPEGPLVLEDIDTTVPAGHCCAIVGPSGVGKTSLVSLVPRLIEPVAGRVLIDGVDVAECDLQDLREAIGIAFQETFLFDTTVLENLRYARPEATHRQIVEVARRTGAHEMIQRLPASYGTVLGEGGITLSRGEKQRLTLTRAMLKNPQILILDEATASIDQPSVQQILPAILEFMRGKTTLMITHRPELLTHADMVMQLHEGRLVYSGSPDRVDVRRFGPTWPQTQQAGEPRSSGDSGLSSALRTIALAVTLTLGLLGGNAWAQQASQETNQPKGQPAEQAASPDPSRLGRFISLDGLSTIEADELLDIARAKARTELGYTPAADALAGELPTPPEGMRSMAVMARQAEDGLRLLRIGYQSYMSQPPHILVDGLILTDDGSAANEQVADMVDVVENARKSLRAQRANLKVSDLAVETMDLSYIEADRCLAVLKVLGYQTVEYKAGGKGVGKSEIIQPSGQVDAGNLPAIISMPATAASNLVGESQIGGGAFGLSMTPSVASELPANTAAAPTMQLMVLYHPARPQQFSELKHRIQSRIDVPARQILIEAMVLEISQTGLTQLGVEWELTSPFGSEPYDQVDTLKLGRLPSNFSATQSTLNVAISDVLGHFEARLRALVRSGEAEILSRPSVLTLDNRQASIRVGEDIPVATSVAGLRNNDKISFNFQYLPTGILLNVRPRVAPDRNEVSMQIDGIVSAEVPGEQLEIRAQDGEEVLATAPRISTRRVQTYSRIANNTPFIIGGLVSRDRTSTKEKVPLLGDLPLVGGLFRNETIDTLKREVIIVITPYVLPDNKVVGRNMPKDEDMFDSFDNRLFRDAYRIRADDVFDLSFLRENEQLQQMSKRAEQVIRRNFRLAEQYPFNHFVGGRIPGERILVYRQMYEVVKRLDIDDRIQTIELRGGVQADPMIFFKPDASSLSGFKVRFLWPYLMGQTEVEVDDQYDHGTKIYQWLQDNGKALALTYTLRETSEPKEVLAHPVPNARLVDCPNRDAWDQVLSDLNTRDDQGRQQFTILLQNADDWTRLKRAAVLKQVVQLNANAKALSLDNFSIGRLLLMPTIHQDKVYLIDDQTAKYFYYTEQYYPALQKEMTRDLEALREALSKRGLSPTPEKQ